MAVGDRVGDDIESICGKCGDVWHVVVAKVGAKIVKVQCKQCGALHRHRPPAGKSAPAGATTSSSARPARETPASSSRTPARASKTPRAPRPSEGPLVEADPSRPVRAYKATGEFTPGDRIQHPTFGVGIVETSSAAEGKIQVFFPAGRRVLVQAKPASKLEVPRRRATFGDDSG